MWSFPFLRSPALPAAAGVSYHSSEHEMLVVGSVISGGLTKVHKQNLKGKCFAAFLETRSLFII